MYLAVVQRIKDGWLRTGGGFERRAPVTVTYGLPIEFRRRRRLSACCQIYNCPHLGAARCRSRAVTAPRLLGWLSSGRTGPIAVTYVGRLFRLWTIT